MKLLGTILMGALLGAVVPVLVGVLAMVVNKFEPEAVWAWAGLSPLIIASTVLGALVGVYLWLWAAIAAGPVVTGCVVLFLYWYGRNDRH